MADYRYLIINKVWNRLLVVEGGYVNDPNDPGGETKYGISKRFYPRVDIKNLTKDDAKKIFVKDYFNPYFGLFGKLNTECIEYYEQDKEHYEDGADFSGAILFYVQFFGFLYNSTPQQTIKVLQKTFNDYDTFTGIGGEMLVVDGVCGVRTIGAANAYVDLENVGLMSSILIANICSKYSEFKNFDKYGKGWIRRVNRLIAGE